MIYAEAETAQEIAILLRMMDSEESLKARLVADRLMGKKSFTGEGEGIQITAPRGVGKTTELLRYAEENNPFGQFAIVCRDQGAREYIIKLHWEIFNKIDQAARVAAKLMNRPISGGLINPPLIVTPGTLHHLRGHNKPIYVDEVRSIANTDFMRELIATGRFVATVTS